MPQWVFRTSTDSSPCRQLKDDRLSPWASQVGAVQMDYIPSLPLCIPNTAQLIPTSIQLFCPVSKHGWPLSLTWKSSKVISWNLKSFQQVDESRSTSIKMFVSLKIKRNKGRDRKPKGNIIIVPLTFCLSPREMWSYVACGLISAEPRFNSLEAIRVFWKRMQTGDWEWKVNMFCALKQEIDFLQNIETELREKNRSVLSD